MRIQVVSVPWGVIRHRGLKITASDGQPIVYANASHTGVARQSVCDFAEGRTIRIERFSTALQPSQILARAELMRDKPYDFFFWNCDHFVASALGKPIESRQLQVAALALLGAFAFARLSI